MESFVGLVWLHVEQSNSKIFLHLDAYIWMRTLRDAGYLPGASGNEDAQTKVYANAAASQPGYYDKYFHQKMYQKYPGQK